MKYLYRAIILLSLFSRADASDNSLESSIYSSLLCSSYRPAPSVSISKDEISNATRCAYFVYKIVDESNGKSPKAQELTSFLSEQEAKGAQVTIFEGDTGHTVVSNLYVTRSKMGFVLETEESLFVAFRGTVTAADVLTDLYIWNMWMQKDYFNGNGRGRVHVGFNKTFESIKPRLEKIIFDALRQSKKTVIFAGHSMGGALANLAALWLAQESKAYGIFDLDIKLVTFNAPRVGSESFSTLLHQHIGLNNTARFTNGEREIASMIVFGTLGFKHAGTNVVLNNTGTSRIADHRMAGFLNGGSEKAYAAHNAEPKKANGVKTQISIHRSYIYLYFLAFHTATTQALSTRAQSVSNLLWKAMGY